MTRTHRHGVMFYTLPAELEPPHGMSSSAATAAVAEPSGPLTMIPQQLPGLSWTTDTDLRLTLTQGSALNFLDRRGDQVVGQSLAAFFQTEDPDFAPIAAHRCALGGQAMNFEFELAHRRFLGLAEPLFDDAGDLAGTIANALDITDYYRMQEQCRVLEAETHDHDKVTCLKTFAGGVAHNFNNLLTVMIGHTTLARAQLPPESPLLAVLNEIEAAAHTAADFAGQMLTYAQKARGQTQRLSLSRLVEDLRPRMRCCLRDDVMLQTDLADNLPPVEGDPAQLQRLVMTLFFNASEAIAADAGIISLWTQAVPLTGAFCAELGLEPPLHGGYYVWLQISDTGCGMDEDTRERIFEPFYSTKFTGRGLGLAAAHGIVQQHQGGMAVSSKPGLGTTFHVLLPCAKVP